MIRIVLLLIFSATAHFSVAQPSKPNVLFILADDLGIGDLGCYGNPYVETPNLNQLAFSGVRLTDHYAPSPLCAPSRAGYLTGRYNHRTGAIDVPSNRGLDRLALSEKTFGDYFRYAGYRTALIGKWHNGLYCSDHLPHNRGFDWFFGFPNGGQDYWKWNLLNNDESVPHDGRYLTDVLNDATIEFIESAHKQEKKFALFPAHHVPHSPFQAPEDLVIKYRRILARTGRDSPEDKVPIIYAMIEAMDTGLGRVFETLRRLDIEKETIVVFTSDNGAFLGNAEGGSTKRYRGPYSGNKGDVGEQGIRVPAIVSWPGTIVGQRVISTPIHGCDWLPTLYGLTKSPIPSDGKPFDGLDVMPLLQGQSSEKVDARILLFQKNRYYPVAHSDGCVRNGHWKLVWPSIPETMRKQSTRDNPSYRRGIDQPHWEMPLDYGLQKFVGLRPLKPQLFNLAADPGERNDLALEYPSEVKRLSDSYNIWFEDVMKDWIKARETIVEHDRNYWMGRTVPDPNVLYENYWLWSKVSEENRQMDPLSLFKGYWTNQEN